MREILFKAKRIDNGEWVEGFIFQLYDNSTWCIGTEPLYPNDYSELIGENRAWFRIDKDTICQYTGMTDKKGNKIWENDIVVYDNSPYNAYCTPHRGEITFRNGCMCFKYLLYGSVTYMSFLSDDFFAMKCKVLGNMLDESN